MNARDTSIEARAAQRAAQQRLGAIARVELAFEMSNDARLISLAGIRSRHPNLSEDEARSRLLERLLGSELYGIAYAKARPSAKS